MHKVKARGGRPDGLLEVGEKRLRHDVRDEPIRESTIRNGALKTTLKAEIDADVWATLNSAIS